MGATDRFDGDRFLVEQLIRPVANVYRVSRLDPAGAAEPVAFVRQKRLALREDIRAFADETESEEVFRIRARQVMDVRGRYDILAPEGDRIGVLERRFAQSLVRSTWGILDASEQEVGQAREKNMLVALARRLTDFPLPYHFTIFLGEREVGALMRRFSMRDRYELDLAGDVERRIERRVGVALAIALDALEQR